MCVLLTLTRSPRYLTSVPEVKNQVPSSFSLHNQTLIYSLLSITLFFLVGSSRSPERQRITGENQEDSSTTYNHKEHLPRVGGGFI